MVKKIWVFIALVAGLVLGFFLTTYGAYVLGFSTAEAEGWGARQAASARAAVNEPRPVPAASTRRVADPPPAPPVTSPPPQEKGANTPPASISMAIENADPERYDYGSYSGYSLPVDAGPRFGVQIAESIKAGRNDSLAVEHLQLEREVRDDSWSYPLEAELQNMLATDPVMGKFTIDHLECRATLCELRLSGKDRLQESSAVTRWLHDMSRMRWPGGVTVGTASFAATEGGSEGIVMLRKPPAKG